MSRAKFLGSILTIFSLAASGIAGNAAGIVPTGDLYWVSFSHHFHRQSEQVRTFFLMQIDSAGHVIKEPVAVMEDATPLSKTTISNDKGKSINLWFAKKDGFIYRNNIDKESLKSVKIVKTPISATNIYYLDVTQKDRRNFLAINAAASFGFPTLNTYGVYVTGETKGTNWQIVGEKLRCGYSCYGRITSGGTTAFWVISDYYNKTLYTQPLTSSGRSSSPPHRILQLGYWQAIQAIDVTDLLSDNRRLVFRSDFAGNQIRLDLLSFVDTPTVSTLTETVAVRNLSGKLSDFAIESSGQFVLYSIKDDESGARLIFQALDATGHPSGSRKRLFTGYLVDGLDILKD